MPKFNSVQRFLRSSKILRGLALWDLRKVRADRSNARSRYENSVMSGIGTLIFIWGGIERQLNSLICFYHPYAPAKLRAKPLPDNLNQKILYLVEIGRDPRVPDRVKHKITSWIPKLGRLREHRHLIVHGTVFQKDRASKRWFAHRLKMNAGWPVVEEIELSNDDLNTKLDEVSDLSQDMASTLNPIFFGPDWRS